MNTNKYTRNIFYRCNFYFLFNLCHIFITIYLVPLYPPAPSNYHIVVHIHESFFLFAQSLHPPTSCSLQLSSSSPSMSPSTYFLLVQFVHQIPHISEIIWYFSFSDWLISLSIMFSRSIYTVTNGKIFFFHYGQVVFHCVNIP